MNVQLNHDTHNFIQFYTYVQKENWPSHCIPPMHTQRKGSACMMATMEPQQQTVK